MTTKTRPSRVVVACAAVGLLIASGGCTDQADAAGNSPEAEWMPEVTWARLPDGSYGWSEQDDFGFHGERCWKDARGYRCIQLLRVDPKSDELEVTDGGRVTFYSRRTNKLEKHKTYPEFGYSCELLAQLPILGVRGVDAEERIALPSGASIKNEVRFSFETNAWSKKYVEDFAASNSLSEASIVHFNCEALAAFLERANDQAFLTTALNERDVFST